LTEIISLMGATSLENFAKASLAKLTVVPSPSSPIEDAVTYAK